MHCIVVITNLWKSVTLEFCSRHGESVDAGGGGEEGGGGGGVGGSARPQGTTLAAALPTFPKLQRTAAGRLSAAAAVRRYDGALARILLRINVFAQNFIRYNLWHPSWEMTYKLKSSWIPQINWEYCASTYSAPPPKKNKKIYRGTFVILITPSRWYAMTKRT